MMLDPNSPQKKSTPPSDGNKYEEPLESSLAPTDRDLNDNTNEGNLPSIARPRNPKLPVYVRWLIPRDLPEILAIEERAFDFPWLEEEFVRCLRQRNCIGLAAEHEGMVVGFVVYELHKSKLHVLNFVVDDEFRLSQVGTQMIDKLIGKLSYSGRTSISLEVSEKNLGAQLFFRSVGFRAVSVLKDFYGQPFEDAYLFKYFLE